MLNARSMEHVDEGAGLNVLVLWEDVLGREHGADCREPGPCASFGDSQNALIAQGPALRGDWRKTMILACLSWAFAAIVAHLLS